MRVTDGKAMVKMPASNLLLSLEGGCPENVLSNSDMDIWTT